MHDLLWLLLATLIVADSGRVWGHALSLFLSFFSLSPLLFFLFPHLLHIPGSSELAHAHTMGLENVATLNGFLADKSYIVGYALFLIGFFVSPCLVASMLTWMLTPRSPVASRRRRPTSSSSRRTTLPRRPTTSTPSAGGTISTRSVPSAPRTSLCFLGRETKIIQSGTRGPFIRAAIRGPLTSRFASWFSSSISLIVSLLFIWFSLFGLGRLFLIVLQVPGREEGPRLVRTCREEGGEDR